MKKEVVTFRIESEKKKTLDAIAESMDRDRAYIINEAVDDYIKLHQWQFSHIQIGLQQAKEKIFASESEVLKAFQRWYE